MSYGGKPVAGSIVSSGAPRRLRARTGWVGSSPSSVSVGLMPISLARVSRSRVGIRWTGVAVMIRIPKNESSVSSGTTTNAVRSRSSSRLDTT